MLGALSLLIIASLNDSTLTLSEHTKALPWIPSSSPSPTDLLMTSLSAQSHGEYPEQDQDRLAWSCLSWQDAKFQTWTT
jgi:hypothetical protein